jgi:hypothetical protein
MMDIYQLAYIMEDVVPKIEELDGYLFFDRSDKGAEGLRKMAGQYASLAEAQSWMNIVLLDGFIDNFIGDDWEMDDPSIDKLLSVFERSWSYQVQVLFPQARFVIKRMIDREYGDLGLRLTQI